MNELSVIAKTGDLIATKLKAREAKLPESVKKMWLTRVTASHIVFDPEVEQMLVPVELLIMTVAFLHAMPLVMLAVYVAVKLAPVWGVVLTLAIALPATIVWVLFIVFGFIHSLRSTAERKGMLTRIFMNVAKMIKHKELKLGFRKNVRRGFLVGIGIHVLVVYLLKAHVPVILLCGFGAGFWPFWGVGVILLSLCFSPTVIKAERKLLKN